MWNPATPASLIACEALPLVAPGALRSKIAHCSAKEG